MSWLHDLPKVELHLHLEGAIPLPTLWQLICKYGGDTSVPDIEALKARFEFTDFPHFLDTWIWKSGFLREYEDFTLIAEHFALSLYSQNIRYAEVFYSPAEHTPKIADLGFQTKDLSVQEVTMALRRGLDRVPGVKVKLVPDLIRGLKPETMMQSLLELEEVKEQAGIIGVGLGGAEQMFPPDPYREVYDRARDMGLRTTAHAGEVEGPQSIWAAIKVLGVDRIGHCTSARFDDELVTYLFDHQLCLEMCPLSNVRTVSIENIEEHPIRRFFDEGLLVTVNTDDPEMFNNTLVEEYETLMSVHGFSVAEICQLRDNAIEGSWLSPEAKAELLAEVRRDSHLP